MDPLFDLRRSKKMAPKYATFPQPSRVFHVFSQGQMTLQNHCAVTRAERIHELIAELLRAENPVVVETVSARVLVVDDNEPWRSFFSTTLLKRPDLRVISEAFDGL